MPFPIVLCVEGPLYSYKAFIYPKYRYIMKKNLFFLIPLFCMAALFQSCNDDGNNPPETPENTGSDGNVNLRYDGDFSGVTVQCSSDWYAETDDKWLQLSLMGGSGKETVDVIAAYNTSAESRSGEIRIYRYDENIATYSSGTSPVQVISVTQEGNTEAVKPACFTEFYFENGEIYCTLFGGSEGGAIRDDQSASDIWFYAPSFGSTLIMGVNRDEYKVCNPYVNVSGKDELSGFFKVGDKETANKLVIRQGNTFTAYNDLNNDGAASVHFVYDGKLYYGAGFKYRNIFGGTAQNSSYANDFNCYDPKTGTVTELPNISRGGTGFGWDGSLFYIYNSSIYLLENGGWSIIGTTDSNIIGAQVSGNTVYLVSTAGIKKYSICREGGNIKFDFVSENMLAAAIGGEYSYTHDRNGELYVYDKETRRLYWIENDILASVSLSDSFDTSAYMCGADAGYAYIISGSAMYKTGRNGDTEMLRLIVTRDFEGEYENVGGTIFCFGGTGSNGSSYFSKKRFNSFRPSAYVPMSLSIMPN